MKHSIKEHHSIKKNSKASQDYISVIPPLGCSPYMTYPFELSEYLIKICFQALGSIFHTYGWCCVQNQQIPKGVNAPNWAFRLYKARTKWRKQTERAHN